MAKTCDGFYEITNGLISIVSAPSFTQESLIELYRLADEANQDKAKIPLLLEKLYSLNPKINWNTLTPTILLYVILSLVKGCSMTVDVKLNMDIKLDANQLIEKLVSQENTIEEQIVPDQEKEIDHTTNI